MEEQTSPTPDPPEVIQEEKAGTTKQQRFDLSFIIALVALVISLVGTMTGIYEARVMREQQTIMQAQKSATVWPYVQRYNYVNYIEEENIVQLIHILENKGIGPAIIGDVDYRYKEESVQSYSVVDAIKKHYPNLNISSTQNQQVGQTVLSAGEQIKVFTLVIHPEESIFEMKLDVNEIADYYQSWFCYCSVYNECWRYAEDRLPLQDASCTKPEKL